MEFVDLFCWPARTRRRHPLFTFTFTFTYSSPSPSTFTLKLTKAVSRRWNLMKVTRRGFFSAEPTVKLKPRKPGMMIIVR